LFFFAIVMMMMISVQYPTVHVIDGMFQSGPTTLYHHLHPMMIDEMIDADLSRDAAAVVVVQRRHHYLTEAAAA